MAKEKKLLLFLFLFGVLLTGCSDGPVKAPIPKEQIVQKVYTVQLGSKIVDSPAIVWNGNTKQYQIYFTLKKGTEGKAFKSIRVLTSSDGATWDDKGICYGDHGLGSSGKSGIFYSSPSVTFANSQIHMLVHYSDIVSKQTGNRYFTSYNGLYWKGRPLKLANDYFQDNENAGNASTFKDRKYEVNCLDGSEIIISLVKDRSN